MTEHISKLGEIVDPGSDKITDEELELNAAGKLKENDNESVGVMSEVGDTTKDANGKDVDSPYSDLVNVGSSFVYTVDRNKVDKNKNITKILAPFYLFTYLGLCLTALHYLMEPTQGSSVLRNLPSFFCPRTNPQGKCVRPQLYRIFIPV